MPLIESLEIFFVEVATSGQEQERPALCATCTRPVDTADAVSVGQYEKRFDRIYRYGAPIDRRLVRVRAGDVALPYGYFLVSTFL